MSDDTLHVMRGAAREIEHLRSRVAVLQAIADTVAVFEAALLGRPGPQGAIPDVLWQLKRAIADEEQALEKARTPSKHEDDAQ